MHSKVAVAKDSECHKCAYKVVYLDSRGVFKPSSKPILDYIVLELLYSPDWHLISKFVNLFKQTFGNTPPVCKT